jgi:hypothetical protein
MEAWSWILTAWGATGLLLAGRRVWWAWYVGLAGQGLWLTYGLTTGQGGFIASAFLYGFVYARNARRWTEER